MPTYPQTGLFTSYRHPLGIFVAPIFFFFFFLGQTIVFFISFGQLKKKLGKLFQGPHIQVKGQLKALTFGTFKKNILI